MKGNSLGWAPTFGIASMLTYTRWRRPQESIESFTRTIIARWLRGSLLRCTTPSQNKQRLYVRSWIAAATQRGSENICNKFVSALPEPTGLADRLRLSSHRCSHSRHRRLVSPPPRWRLAGNQLLQPLFSFSDGQLLRTRRR